MGFHAIKFKGVEIMPANKKVPHPIFNMGAGTDCPSAKLGLCRIGQHMCYACRNERRWPASLAFRRRQEIAWRCVGIEVFVEAFRRACEKTGSKVVRFNESGDFADEFIVRKLYAIAGKLPKITFYLYTARRDLFEKNPDLLAQAPKNVVLTGSGFMLHNEFGPWYPGAKHECPGHCGNCNLCKTRGNKTIFNRFH